MNVYKEEKEEGTQIKRTWRERHKGKVELTVREKEKETETTRK